MVTWKHGEGSHVGPVHCIICKIQFVKPKTKLHVVNLTKSWGPHTQYIWEAHPSLKTSIYLVEWNNLCGRVQEVFFLWRCFGFVWSLGIVAWFHSHNGYISNDGLEKFEHVAWWLCLCPCRLIWTPVILFWRHIRDGICMVATSPSTWTYEKDVIPIPTSQKWIFI